MTVWKRMWQRSSLNTQAGIENLTHAFCNYIACSSILCVTANNQRASMCVLYLVSCAYFSNVLVCLVSRVLFRHILLIILVKSKEISHPFQCTFGLAAAAVRLGQSLKRTKLLQTFCSQAWFGAARAELPVSIVACQKQQLIWVRIGPGPWLSGSESGLTRTRSPSLRLILRYRHKFYSHWQN